MTDTMAEPMTEGLPTPVDDGPVMLTSWATTRPQLNAGPFMRAFVRFNVYLYSKPPSKTLNQINKLSLKLNIYAYRASKGRLLGRFGDLDALLITTTGRKSGRARTVPLGYIYERGSFYCVAVPGHFDIPGGAKAIHPAWYLNLRAKPEARVNIGPEEFDANAEILSGDERDAKWQAYNDVYPFINEFQKRAGHLIPVVKLTPTDVLPQNH